jgi:hypothetical protein
MVRSKLLQVNTQRPYSQHQGVRRFDQHVTAHGLHASFGGYIEQCDHYAIGHKRQGFEYL